MFINNKNQNNYQSEKNIKIQEILKDELNNECFDCGKENPDFISANNGVFLCKNCMTKHYQFSDEISLIIRNNLFLLNEEQINYIYYGGNRKLLEFINYKFPKLQHYEPEIFYKTQAMQYYRDNLYFLVEGGNQPIKPTENCAYNLIPNLENYSLEEKIEKNNYINNINNNYNLLDNNEEEIEYSNDGNAEEEEEENNTNLNNENYYPKNNQFNYLNNNKDLIIPYKTNLEREDDNNENIEERNFSDFKNENINKNTINYNKHRKRFFKEMNRLFGGSDSEDEEKAENEINNYNERKNKKSIRNNTYKPKRSPHENFNYNNYIKNTININNNNTNIFLDDKNPFHRNYLSKSQIINLSQDKICNNINNKSIINSPKYIYNSLTQRLEPILSKENNKVKIDKTNLVYVKPKINSINKYIFKSPISQVNENNIIVYPIPK